MDRPFLFLVEDQATGTVRFMGVVFDPRLWRRQWRRDEPNAHSTADPIVRNPADEMLKQLHSRPAKNQKHALAFAVDSQLLLRRNDMTAPPCATSFILRHLPSTIVILLIDGLAPLPHRCPVAESFA